jgi:regulator of replication initiation timing
MNDLISRLRALSRHEHDDLTIGDEAVDEIKRLRVDHAAAMAAMWKRVAELKQLSNDRWRENERLQALNSSLTRKANAYLIENARLAEENTRMRSVLGEIEWSNDTTWQSEAARAALKETP